MKVKTRDELKEYVNRGKRVKYLFFWGHQKKNVITKSCFSQWYCSPFTVDGKKFATAEHYMMYGKAALFSDLDAMEKALNAKEPGEVKAIGRAVKGFNQSIWDENKFALVIAANRAKFSCNDDLKHFLLNTGDRVIVEASPIDRIWGIGLAEGDDDALNPNLWKGENLLGFALMYVRHELKMEMASNE